MLALEVLDACQITYIKTADKGAQSHRPPESLLGRVYPHISTVTPWWSGSYAGSRTSGQSPF